jgi:uncharacterized DUF497 family protein
VVQPAKFRSIEFEWDENNLDEIARHQVGYEEAEECFFNRHQVFRNKKKAGRRYDTFKLSGRTDAGRSLLVIFFVKEKTTVRSLGGPCALIRVITAWEV